MAKKSKTRKEQHRVEVNNIVLGKSNPIPRMLKESKYPWASLLSDEPGVLDFTIPMGSLEEASEMRTSVQSSGRAYYEKRGINRRAIVRVVDLGKGKYGLRAWALAGE